MQLVLMPTGPTRSKRYVQWRVSQVPARKYNRKTKPAQIIATAAPQTMRNHEGTLFSVDVEKLHTCNECGRSAITTRAAFTLIHQH